jgi:acyl carrier protein
MDKNELSRKIENFISERFIFDPEQAIGRDDSLLETGTIDSTSILEVVLFLEENFGIKVDDQDMVPSNLDSVNKIADFVQRKLAPTQSQRV